MRVGSLRQDTRRNFDEILRRFLRFEARDHANDDFVFRYSPFPKLFPLRPRPQEFFNGNGVSGKSPITIAQQSALFCRFRIGVGHEKEFGRDLCCQSFEQDIKLAHDGMLKIIEAESVKGVKNQWNARKLRRPAADDPGFRAVRMNDVRPFAAE